MGAWEPDEQDEHHPHHEPNEHNQIRRWNQIKYLPPTKSYKVLEVQINTMLDFSDHPNYISTNVWLITQVLAKRKLYTLIEKYWR
jgi:hypothetical protein